MESDVVCRYLIENGISEFEVIKHEAVMSMDDVYRVISDSPSRMIKAILLHVKDGPVNYILLGVPADQRVNFDLVAELLSVSKNKIRLATPLEAKNSTGFEKGALIPFSLSPESLPFMIDSSFSSYDYVYFGGGTHHHTLKLHFSELKKLPGYSTCQICSR